VTNLNGLSTQTSVTLTELNQTVSRTLEQSANQNTTVIRGVADEVGALSNQLQNQVGEVTNFTTASTRQFNEILSGMRNQFEEFGQIPEILGTQLADLGLKLSNATEYLNQASASQSELATEMANSVRLLREAFSEAGLSRISGIVEDAEIRFSDINTSLIANEARLSSTLDSINTQVESLNNTSSAINSYGERAEASAKSVDDANNEYIDELSRAAASLRNKTDQI